jgi:hypothetical protein
MCGPQTFVGLTFKFSKRRDIKGPRFLTFPHFLFPIVFITEEHIMTPIAQQCLLTHIHDLLLIRRLDVASAPCILMVAM